jgi:SAM-dependent methyltransferase
MSESGWWNQYYKKHEAPTNCSTFAAFVGQKLPKETTLFELGCGNGRDALYFAKSGLQVEACDISETAIQGLVEEHSDIPTIKFVQGDFTRLEKSKKEYDVIYSRFTLHAVNKEGASRALAWAFNSLKSGGKLFIEVRSVKDKLCGKGTPVENEPDAYVYTHYRRFVRKDDLCKELEELGFTLNEVIEADGLAVYKDDDPVVIRVEALKKATSGI